MHFQRTNSEPEVVLFARNSKLPILSPDGLPVVIGQLNAQDCITAFGKSMNVFVSEPEAPLLITTNVFVNKCFYFQQLYIEFMKPGASFSSMESRHFGTGQKKISNLSCPVVKCLDSMLLKTRSRLYEFGVYTKTSLLVAQM